MSRVALDRQPLWVLRVQNLTKGSDASARPEMRHVPTMLRDTKPGRYARIDGVTHPKCVRAVLMLGLVDGIIIKTLEQHSDGSCTVQLDGGQLRVPAVLANQIQCTVVPNAMSD